jgi:hypothetical protein
VRGALQDHCLAEGMCEIVDSAVGLVELAPACDCADALLHNHPIRIHGTLLSTAGPPSCTAVEQHDLA